MGLADELLEDAHFLAGKGISDNRQTLMRRAIRLLTTRPFISS